MTKILFTGDFFLGGDLHGKDVYNTINSATFHNSILELLIWSNSCYNDKVADKCTVYNHAVDQLNN